MFTAYIDDSGTDPNQSVAVASALIIPGFRIDALKREWDKLKAKEKFTEWHTSEFVAKNQHSEFADGATKSGIGFLDECDKLPKNTV